VVFLVAFTVKKPLSPKELVDLRSFVQMLVGDTGGRTIQNYTRNKIQLTMNWLANTAVSLFYHTAMRSGNFVAMPAIFNLVFTKEVV
jgi:hypothetical protein